MSRMELGIHSHSNIIIICINKMSFDDFFLSNTDGYTQSTPNSSIAKA